MTRTRTSRASGSFLWRDAGLAENVSGRLDSMGSKTMSSWQLSGKAFNKFLKMLDPDRDRAAAAYEALRERVTGLLEWWGAIRAAELADETLDRVARK